MDDLLNWLRLGLFVVVLGIIAGVPGLVIGHWFGVWAGIGLSLMFLFGVLGVIAFFLNMSTPIQSGCLPVVLWAIAGIGFLIFFKAV